MAKQTYTLTLDNCSIKPKINATFSHIPHNRLRRAMDFAILSFRQVQVSADETGEIVLDYYKDFEWFNPTHNCGEALDYLYDICYGTDEV